MVLIDKLVVGVGSGLVAASASVVGLGGFDRGLFAFRRARRGLLDLGSDWMDCNGSKSVA